MHSAILQAINGVSLAALLFLLASGFTLTFGLMRVVNMAHGAYYLLGGYIGYSITRHTGSFALGVLGGGLAIIPLGFLIDRFLISRTGENHLAQVLLTVGIAFVIGDLALKIWGGDNLKVPTPISLRGATELPGGIIYPTYRLVLILIGVGSACRCGFSIARRRSARLFAPASMTARSSAPWASISTAFS